MTQYPLVIFPDAVEVIVGVLTTPDVEPGTPATAYDRVPDPRPDAFSVVRRLGGPRISKVHDSAQVVVDSYALTPEAAHDLAQRNRAVLNALPGSTYTATAGDTAIGAVTELAGPSEQPDSLSDQPRYSQQFTVVLRGIQPS